ncbi:hypothetical protein ID551_27420, partial [Klebsiella pneumoniae]|uniref:hypothetical protein n=1 Tax=Klebsiella pneumoniae TaxID=573 RepID=UPI001BD07FB0
MKKKKDSRADGIKLEKHDGEHYAAYQAAANRWDAASKELTATSVVLTRDTVVQGAGVGANLAQQWSIWNVGGLLQLAKCAVDVGVATIVSGAAGIAS